MKPRQNALSEAGFEEHRRVTRKEAFLSQMDRVLPWSDLEGLIQPIYPRGEGPGRPPIGLDRMLRIFFAAVV